jgi:hypothetical protein
MSTGDARKRRHPVMATAMQVRVVDAGEFER